jgi:hypothetical protein
MWNLRVSAVVMIPTEEREFSEQNFKVRSSTLHWDPQLPGTCYCVFPEWQR